MNKIVFVYLLIVFMIAGCKQQVPVSCQIKPEIHTPTGPLRICKLPKRNQSVDFQSHYMVLGSFQGRLNAPGLSHTFAIFCRVDGNNNILESRTISWVPQTLSVHVLKRDAETGTNLNYKQTYDLAVKNGNNLFFRGPYKIEPELYRRACEQVTELESGRVLFKVGDSTLRPAAINSTHAIADIDREYGFLNTGMSWGDGATSIVEKHLSRWIVQDLTDNSWVLGKIQLELGK
jgi:hypothetical protein